MCLKLFCSGSNGKHESLGAELLRPVGHNQAARKELVCMSPALATNLQWNEFLQPFNIYKKKTLSY